MAEVGAPAGMRGHGANAGANAGSNHEQPWRSCQPEQPQHADKAAAVSRSAVALRTHRLNGWDDEVGREKGWPLRDSATCLSCAIALKKGGTA